MLNDIIIHIHVLLQRIPGSVRFRPCDMDNYFSAITTGPLCFTTQLVAACPYVYAHRSRLRNNETSTSSTTSVLNAFVRQQLMTHPCNQLSQRHLFLPSRTGSFVLDINHLRHRRHCVQTPITGIYPASKKVPHLMSHVIPDTWRAPARGLDCLIDFFPQSLLLFW